MTLKMMIGNFSVCELASSLFRGMLTAREIGNLQMTSTQFYDGIFNNSELMVLVKGILTEAYVKWLSVNAYIVSLPASIVLYKETCDMIFDGGFAVQQKQLDVQSISIRASPKRNLTRIYNLLRQCVNLKEFTWSSSAFVNSRFVFKLLKGLHGGVSNLTSVTINIPSLEVSFLTKLISKCTSGLLVHVDFATVAIFSKLTIPHYCRL